MQRSRDTERQRWWRQRRQRPRSAPWQLSHLSKPEEALPEARPELEKPTSSTTTTLKLMLLCQRYFRAVAENAETQLWQLLVPIPRKKRIRWGHFPRDCKSLEKRIEGFKPKTQWLDNIPAVPVIYSSSKANQQLIVNSKKSTYPSYA